MTYALLGTGEQGKPVHLAQSSRREGTYILGATGTGKSTLFEHLIIQDVKQGLGVCLLDPHGDLTNAVISRMMYLSEYAPKERMRRLIKKRLEEHVIVLDLVNEEHFFGLNLYDCADSNSIRVVQKTVNRVLNIFKKLYDISRGTPSMIYYLRNCAYTIIANPGNTIAEIPDLLTSPVLRRKLLANVKNPHVLKFWSEFEKVEAHKYFYLQEVRPILNKLDEFLQPMQLNIFGQAKSTIDLRTIMDERKLLFIKLDPENQDLSTLIGAAIIAQLLIAAYSRRDLFINKRRQFNVYADEFQWFATEDFATLFTEARKYGIGLTVGHQVIEQLEPRIKATCKQARTIIVFSVSSDNAKEIAGTFDCSPIPGPPILIPLKTPVKEPIQFMHTHGVHPLPHVREFMERYGQMLIDGAEKEENHAREYASSLRRYTVSDRGESHAVVTPPSIDCTTTLAFLNNLFYRAMLAGKEKKSIDDMSIPGEMFSALMPSIAVEARYRHSLISQYASLTRNSGVQVTDYNERIRELKNKIPQLDAYQLRKMQELEAQVRVAKKLLPVVYKRHLLAELDAVRENCVIVRKDFSYYPVELKNSVSYPDIDYDFSFKPFATWKEAVAYYCDKFATAWFCVENSLYEKEWWQHKISRVSRSLSSTYGHWVIELLDTWVPKPGIEQTWYTRRMFDVALAMRIEPDNQPYEVRNQINATESYVDYNSGVSKKLRDIQGQIYTAKRNLKEQTEVITAQVGMEKQQIEQELALLNQIQTEQSLYEKEKSELQELLLEICRELAQSPVETDSGLTQEVPTWIETAQVEARIANQLKLQENFTARVRTKTGEYTITTDKSDERISETALNQCIADILDRNVAAGYLRKRSEIEEEIAKRSQLPALKLKQQPSPAPGVQDAQQPPSAKPHLKPGVVPPSPRKKHTIKDDGVSGA